MNENNEIKIKDLPLLMFLYPIRGQQCFTDLLSAIPYVGIDLVQWVWGGIAVDNATLNRFFTFHFLLPFIIAAIIDFVERNANGENIKLQNEFFLFIEISSM